MVTQSTIKIIRMCNYFYIGLLYNNRKKLCEIGWGVYSMFLVCLILFPYIGYAYIFHDSAVCGEWGNIAFLFFGKNISTLGCLFGYFERFLNCFF